MRESRSGGSEERRCEERSSEVEVLLGLVKKSERTCSTESGGGCGDIVRRSEEGWTGRSIPQNGDSEIVDVVKWDGRLPFESKIHAIELCSV